MCIRDRQSGGAIPGAEHEMYTFIDRLCIAGYNVFFYLFKIGWPLFLSALYPYPQHLSIAHYLSPIALILLVIAVGWYGIRYRQPLLLLGFFWFIITIAPVLQLLPVGHAVAADRYTYLPAIGISLLIAMAAALLFQHFSNRIQLLSITAGVICMLLALQTFRQVSIWENSLSLWGHSLTVCPTADLAWYNRGQIHYEQKNYAAALADYTRAAELVAHLPNKGADALNNQGLSLQQLARPAEAVAAHSLAIQKLPNYTIAFYNRGNAYQFLNKLDSAKADYQQTIRLQPDYAPAWFNLGVTFQQLGQIDSAFHCYNQSISLAPKNASAYINRGHLYYKQGKIEQALADFETAVSIEPQNTNYIRNRDLAKKRLQGNSAGNAEMAKAANEAGLAFAQKKQYASALREFCRALVLDSSQGGYFYNRALAYHFLGKNDSARIDAIHAQKLGFKGFDPKFLHNIGIK
jgi:tetratricopeptide (TPR) repeat protein